MPRQAGCDLPLHLNCVGVCVGVRGRAWDGLGLRVWVSLPVLVFVVVVRGHMGQASTQGALSLRLSPTAMCFGDFWS